MSFIRTSCFSIGKSTLISKAILMRYQHYISTGQIRPASTHSKPFGIPDFDKKKAQIQDTKKLLPSYLESLTISEDECEQLFKSFPPIVHELVTHPETRCLRAANKRMEKLLNYFVPWSPHLVLQFFIANRFYVQRQNKMYPNNIQNGNEDLKLSNVLGWALEICFRAVYVRDDIMDGMTTRNNLPSWHTLPEVGMHAINDAAWLEKACFLILKKHFSQMDYYIELVELIQERAYDTLMGESQMATIKPSLNQENDHTFEQVLIAKCHLNAHMLPNLPIEAAMLMNEFKDRELITEANKIGFELMHFLTIVEDCADCYKDVDVMEREAGTDIAFGKNSWLIWKALELGNTEQRKRLLECYGKKDAACISEVKDIYQVLKIETVLIKMATDMASRLKKKISELPQNDLPCEIYYNVISHFSNVAAGTVARV